MSNAMNARPAKDHRAHDAEGGHGHTAGAKLRQSEKVVAEVHSPVVSLIFCSIKLSEKFLNFPPNDSPSSQWKSIADPIHEWWVSGEIITFIATMMKCGLAKGQCTCSGNVLRIGETQFARIGSTAVAYSTDSHHCASIPFACAQIAEWWRAGKCMVIRSYEGARSDRRTSPTEE